jgi:hypothetical protein
MHTGVGRLNERPPTGASQSVAQNDYDTIRAEAAFRELLIAVGDDPDRDGMFAVFTPIPIQCSIQRSTRVTGTCSCTRQSDLLDVRTPPSFAPSPSVRLFADKQLPPTNHRLSPIRLV